MKSKPLYKLRIERTEAILKCDDLDSNEKLVLIAINSFIYNGKDCCWPAQAKLTKRCSLHRVTLNRVVGRLRDKGYLATDYHGDSSVLEYRIEWAKLGLSHGREPVTENYRGCSRELQGVVAESYTEQEKTLNRQKGTNQTAKASPCLSVSAVAATPPQTDRPAAPEQGMRDGPTVEPAGFQQFLERWATTLPDSPLASGDVAAWAAEWDRSTELRDGWPSLLTIIEGDDFLAGRKPGKNGQLFIMSPRYLLGQDDGQPRWAGVLLGTFGSAAQTIKRLGLLAAPELEPSIPTCVWDEAANCWRRVAADSEPGMTSRPTTVHCLEPAPSLPPAAGGGTNIQDLLDELDGD